MANRKVTIQGTKVGLDINKLAIYRDLIEEDNLVTIVSKEAFMNGFEFDDDDEQEDYVIQADNPCKTVVNLSLRKKNFPPTVNITGSTSALAGTSVTLTANGTDPNGDTLAYQWNDLSTTQTNSVTSAIEGSVTYSVVATDPLGLWGNDTHTIVWFTTTTTTTTAAPTTTTTLAPGQTTTTTTAAPTTTTTAAPTTTTTAAPTTTTTTTAYSPSGAETINNGSSYLSDISSEMNKFVGAYNAEYDLTEASGGEDYGTYFRFTNYSSPYNLWITGRNNGSVDEQNVVLVSYAALLFPEQSVWIDGTEISFSSVGSSAPYTSIDTGWSMKVIKNGFTNGTSSDEVPPNTYPNPPFYNPVYPDTSSTVFVTGADTEAHAFFMGTVAANYPSLYGGPQPALSSVFETPLNNTFIAPAASAYKMWLRIKRDASVSASTRPPVLEFRSYQSNSYGSSTRGGIINGRGFFN